MDIKIWEKPILAWVNSMSTLTPIKSVNHINDRVLTDVIRKVKSDFQDDIVEFLKEIFPNLVNDDLFKLLSSIDYVCAATLLLIYVSFSKRTDLEGLREIMCTRLDNSIQVNIAEFLMHIQEHENVFNLSFKTIKQEIYDFSEKYVSQAAIIGDSVKTPVKSNISNNSFGSPLQGFFQTPKKNQSSRKLSSCGSIMCGDGDHLKLIKKLTNQLVEEELEKASLQEQLNNHTQKCNEYEMKLRNKIDEINLLKSEWENESKKNDVEFKSLKNSLMRKLEDEKKLKNELSHLENYVNVLESDLSNSVSEKDKLEFQLKEALDKCLKHESQLNEVSELNMQLQKVIDSKEAELVKLKEEYVKNFKDEKSIDMSYMDGSFDRSICQPETLGVVIDKLLVEKNEENASLKETIKELQKEKLHLYQEIQLINEQLSLKCSTISELEFLNKELGAKVENFDSTEKELLKIRKELDNANIEIDKVMRENSHLNEKFNALNISLQERERALISCNNSKMLLHMNFLKLAEDFKTVQKRLELEIKNISMLTLGTKENYLKLEKSLTSPEESNVDVDPVKFTKNLGCCQEVSSDLETEERHSITSQIFEDEKLEKITELLQHFENHHVEWSESKNSMQKTCSKLNDNLIILKIKINELEKNHKNSIEEKRELEKHLKKAEEKVSEIQSSHDFEIKKLNVELEVKETKIKELQEAIIEFQKVKDSLLLENEYLKRESEKALKKNDSKTILEGGDFASQKTGFENRFNEARKIEINQEQQDLSDSLEEVPVCNKTFDIVNLEEKNIINKTFSVKKEIENFDKRCSKSNSTWVVSPPSKIPPKVPLKVSSKRKAEKSTNGETWVVPITPVQSKEKPQKISSSVNDLTVKVETARVGSNSNLTKSTSLSSILEIDFSPQKNESKSSVASSFASLTDSANVIKKTELSETQNIQIKKLVETNASEGHIQKTQSLERSPVKNFRLVERNEDPLGEVFNRNLMQDDLKLALEMKNSGLQKEVAELSKECQHLRSVLLDSEQKRKKDKEIFEKNQEIIRQNISLKYESQLEHLKNEMKQLHNRELAKHKVEQSKLNSELREQNKRYKEHIDELRNQLWDLGEKLLNEQKLKRDLERNYAELKKKFENVFLFKDSSEAKSLRGSEIYYPKESCGDDNFRITGFRQVPNTAFPTMPTEDEDEVFDNRFLEDMKTGEFKPEKPEGRLMELQYRNSLCLPHLKSSYPGETQFHNPALYKENDLKLGLLQFGQESQSLTDSDHSMTRSLIPESKGKKKEQTSYKKPGPPTPSKNGGRLSIQSGDLRMTPRNVLKEISDQNERNKGTPNPLKGLLSKSVKTGSLGSKDENTAPVVTPRKKSKFFRKPFGARDH